MDMHTDYKEICSDKTKKILLFSAISLFALVVIYMVIWYVIQYIRINEAESMDIPIISSQQLENIQQNKDKLVEIGYKLSDTTEDFTDYDYYEKFNEDYLNITIRIFDNSISKTDDRYMTIYLNQDVYFNSSYDVNYSSQHGNIEVFIHLENIEKESLERISVLLKQLNTLK